MARHEVETSFKVALLIEGVSKGAAFLALGWATAGLGVLAHSATTSFMEWATNAPILYLDTSGMFGKLSSIAVRAPGHFVVFGHGNRNGPLTKEGSANVSAVDLQALIKCQTSYKPGAPVLIISCEVGAGDYAQKLADHLQANVVASPDLVGLFGQTKQPAGSSNLRAKWYRFTPD